MRYQVHCKLPEGEASGFSLLGFEDLGEVMAEIDLMEREGTLAPVGEFERFSVMSEDGMEFASFQR